MNLTELANEVSQNRSQSAESEEETFHHRTLVSVGPSQTQTVLTLVLMRGDSGEGVRRAMILFSKWSPPSLLASVDGLKTNRSSAKSSTNFFLLFRLSTNSLLLLLYEESRGRRLSTPLHTEASSDKSRLCLMCMLLLYRWRVSIVLRRRAS